MKLNWEVIAEQAFIMSVNRSGPDYKIHEEPMFTDEDKKALYGKMLPLETKDIPSEVPEDELSFYYLGGSDESGED